MYPSELTLLKKTKALHYEMFILPSEGASVRGDRCSGKATSDVHKTGRKPDLRDDKPKPDLRTVVPEKNGTDFPPHIKCRCLPDEAPLRDYTDHGALRKPSENENKKVY